MKSSTTLHFHAAVLKRRAITSRPISTNIGYMFGAKGEIN